MTQTFKVGDKVVNDVFGPGEIVYGPYGDDGSSYFMKAENGLHHTVSAELLKRAAKFEVGDKVRSSVATYTVEAGPFFSPAEWYAVKDSDGNVLHSDTHGLTAVDLAEPKLKVGDRVRIVQDDPTIRPGQFVGKTGVVTRLNGPDSRLPVNVRFDEGQDVPFTTWNVTEVARLDTYEHDGVTYDLSARYRDRDGDVWEFARFGGEVVAAIGRKPVDKYDGDSFSVAAGYGPLTRV
jgi:hypothetical protein